jgi:DNA-binding helix-hairpin-helix protein with protein kinase domain
MERTMPFHSTILPMPAETLALSRYDIACRALAAAKAVDDVMDVVAHADAVRVYARQAKNRQMEIDAAEIRIRAERRLGELMAAQAATIGTAKGAAEAGTNRGTTRVEIKPASLAEAGIDKNLAHRARTYAAVPSEEFETLLTDKRQSENRRVVLDPGIRRDKRVARTSADGLAAENDRLALQMTELRRRIAALLEENGALKHREAMWRERALAAGWTELAA